MDQDPLAVAHGQALLATTDSVAFIQQDLRRPTEIFPPPSPTVISPGTRCYGWLYTLDLLLPIVDLGQKNTFVATRPLGATKIGAANNILSIFDRTLTSIPLPL